MIDLAYVQCMARYNRWQNENVYGVADALPDTAIAGPFSVPSRQR